ncbi:ADP-ribose pyrophosphatase [Lentzea guizhouensis]|uniref:ADP-ribose pyrophosphatase n=1 Tax=Lentzea guizhouensis TaxID=1586287 RepID=A0A1B2HM36_9PSEU|nr:NUDIX hydrolase [Lentzea guizhouensis]ANZ38797.1 ADP-ribose pyrophosphatase [Lentzea guizhouensis]
MTRHDFRTVASEDLHVGRILALRVDEVEMPGGGTAKREIVEHTGAVAVVAVSDSGEVTLVHQYRHALGRHLWELPAGLLDHDGEPPVTGARRELVEEVGLDATEWHVLVDVAASPGFTDEVVRVFLARGLTEVDRDVQGDEEADLEVHRFGLDEAVRMVLAGDIVNASSVAGLLAAREVLEGRAEPRPADAPFRDKPTRFPARKK